MNLVNECDVECPYCGEVFAITIDTSQGSYTMTEDCTVCCRPISFTVECEPGEVISVATAIG